MRNVTVDIPIYTFDELEEDSRQAVIDKYGSHIRPKDIFNNIVIDKLKAECFEDINLYYDLGHSQGDGLCFTGKISINNLKLRQGVWAAIEDLLPKEFVDNLVECCDYVEIHKNSYIYQHSKTVTFVLNNSSWCNCDDYETFIDLFRKLYEYTCGKYEKYGYKYFYEISNETVKEWADANSYEFTKDGTIFNQST